MIRRYVGQIKGVAFAIDRESGRLLAYPVGEPTRAVPVSGRTIAQEVYAMLELGCAGLRQCVRDQAGREGVVPEWVTW